MLTFIQILSLITGVWSAFTRKKFFVLLSTAIFNTSMLLCYIVTKDYVALGSSILICTRSIIYLYKEKLSRFNIIPFLFISLHIITGIIKLQNPYQIITIVAPCLICYCFWFVDNLQEIRLFNTINSILWFMYMIHCELYISSINYILNCIIFIISYLYYKHYNINK